MIGWLIALFKPSGLIQITPGIVICTQGADSSLAEIDGADNSFDSIKGSDNTVITLYVDLDC